jgi:hypothetical protein
MLVRRLAGGMDPGDSGLDEADLEGVVRLKRVGLLNGAAFSVQAAANTARLRRSLRRVSCSRDLTFGCRISKMKVAPRAKLTNGMKSLSMRALRSIAVSAALGSRCSLRARGWENLSALQTTTGPTSRANRYRRPKNWRNGRAESGQILRSDSRLPACSSHGRNGKRASGTLECPNMALTSLPTPYPRFQHVVGFCS